MAILVPKIVKKSIFSPQSRFLDPWLPVLSLSQSPSGCLHTLSHSNYTENHQNVYRYVHNVGIAQDVGATARGNGKREGS